VCSSDLPQDSAIAEHLGDVYLKLGKIKEAQEMYKRALKIDPKNTLLQKKLEDTKKKTK
jgi:predicted negative regulator of RcsB-dependent stress response